MAKATRRNHAEPSLSGPDDDDEVIREDAPLEAEQSAYLRNEARNERMHVRVQLPFHVVIDGRRYAGHDISTSGFSTAKRPAIDSNATVQRSEEHTSELQSLMRISYAVFCLKKKKFNIKHTVIK